MNRSAGYSWEELLLGGRLLLVHLEDGPGTGVGPHLEQRSTGCTVHSRLGFNASLQTTRPCAPGVR